MACAIHGQTAHCDNTCAGYIHGTSETAEAPAEPAPFDPATAGPPFENYQQLAEAFKAQHAAQEPPTEEFAREQGWLADNDEKADAGASE
jgi:hypothetical protein